MYIGLNIPYTYSRMVRLVNNLPVVDGMYSSPNADPSKRAYSVTAYPTMQFHNYTSSLIRLLEIQGKLWYWLGSIQDKPSVLLYSKHSFWNSCQPKASTY